MWTLVNRTPYAADRTWVQDPDGTKRWVVVVKATFGIHADGRLTLADEQLPPLLAPEYHGVDGASSLRYEADLVPPKPGTDVVLVGHAYAPGGRPATHVPVALGVGSQRKILAVTGDRVWKRSLVGTVVPSAPVPFLRLPLVYERAYGGHDACSSDPEAQRMFAENPVGIGHVAHRASLRLPHEKVATTYCNINGERWRTDEFLYVPLRLHAPFIDANRYESPADAWGDVGAASGPLYVALAVASAERGYARGRHVLAWTSSDGGTRAAVTLTLPPHCNGER